MRQQLIEAGDTLAAIMVAALLQWPVREARLKAMYGRLALISYTPVRKKDPEILILIAQGARPVNQAMRAFQEARRPIQDPGAWLSTTGEAARGVLEALRAADGTPYEVGVTSLWLAAKMATMATVEPLHTKDGGKNEEVPYYMRDDWQGF